MESANDSYDQILCPSRQVHGGTNLFQAQAARTNICLAKSDKARIRRRHQRHHPNHQQF